jgi:hypothetical protein
VLQPELAVLPNEKALPPPETFEAKVEIWVSIFNGNCSPKSGIKLEDKYCYSKIASVGFGVW